MGYDFSHHRLPIGAEKPDKVNSVGKVRMNDDLALILVDFLFENLLTFVICNADLLKNLIAPLDGNAIPGRIGKNFKCL